MKSGVPLAQWIVLFSSAERKVKAQNRLSQSLGLIPNSITHLLDDCVQFIEIHILKDIEVLSPTKLKGSLAVKSL